MKKTVLAAAVLMIMTALAGCGGNGENVDINTVYSGISPMAEGTLVEMNDNYISNYYGIETADLSDYVFAQSDDPKSAETIIMFKCEDSEKRKAYTQAVENALDQKYDELTNYNLPDEAKLVEEANVKSAGSFVYLIISDNGESMDNIIKDSL